ncbi:hypothetical protein [Actinophytocola sp.]
MDSSAAAAMIAAGLVFQCMTRRSIACITASSTVAKNMRSTIPA